MKFASKLMWGAGIILVIIIVWALVAQNSPSQYDSFAKCVTSTGMKMYGASWCGHCKDQEAMFGNSFKYVSYVECSPPPLNGAETSECTLAGIQSFPTWQFPDGTKKSGILSLQEISIFSNCSLPK